MFNPALTTCASERMKTQRFSYFADFAARERMREAKPVKLKKVGFSHFFDTLRAGKYPALFMYVLVAATATAAAAATTIIAPAEDQQEDYDPPPTVISPVTHIILPPLISGA